MSGLRRPQLAPFLGRQLAKGRPLLEGGVSRLPRVALFFEFIVCHRPSKVCTGNRLVSRPVLVAGAGLGALFRLLVSTFDYSPSRFRTPR